MFRNGDLIRIKDKYKNPGEKDWLYRVVNVNEVTRHCNIVPAETSLPLPPQELVSFDMIHLFRAAPTKVHYNDRYILEDNQGNKFTEIPDSDHLMSQTTGEIYRVCKAYEIDNPIEVETLQQYMDGIERIMRMENCGWDAAERFYHLTFLLADDGFTPEQGKGIYAELEP